MFEIDVLKESALAKKLGGLPIFHDGFLKYVSITKEAMTLDIDILSRNNPLLSRDTTVRLSLNGLKSFTLLTKEIEHGLLIIHQLDIRKEDETLHMILESARGQISEVIFETIELKEPTH